jgi:hypothetical protein
MAITNLLIQMKPEEIPDFMKGQFFELYSSEDNYGEYREPEYVGWVHIREDGRIEFGEPGV